MSVALAPYIGLNAPLDAVTFLRLAEAGAFGGARVELVEGKVVFKMAQSRLHMNALKLAEGAFGAYSDLGLSVLNQFTLRLDPSGAPDPDLLLARYDARTATRAIRAEDVALVVEVSVTSLREDREEKARMYARALIPEYWILNPVARQVEIRRDPSPEGYVSLDVQPEDGSAAPMFAPGRPLRLDALWPALSPDDDVL